MDDYLRLYYSHSPYFTLLRSSSRVRALNVGVNSDWHFSTTVSRSIKKICRVTTLNAVSCWNLITVTVVNSLELRQTRMNVLLRTCVPLNAPKW